MKFSSLLSKVISTFVFIIFSFLQVHTASAQLSGTYTIDPGQKASKSNYVSIVDAVRDLTKGTRLYSGVTANGPGISGPVVFKIADGTYTDGENITKIKGTSATNTITFTAASGDSSKTTLNSGGSSGGVFNLDGAQYIIIKNISFNYIINGPYFIRLGNAANNNNIKGCCFLGNGTSKPNADIWIQEADSSNSIDNNYFRNFKRAISCEIKNTGNPGAYNTTIKNNVLDSGSEYGIYASDPKNMYITGNIMTHIMGSSTSGIYLYNISGELAMTRNFISADMGASIQGYAGLKLTSGNISNNMFICRDAGMGISYLRNIYFYYNTVTIYNTTFSANATWAVGISKCDTIWMRNNNLSNFGGGAALYITKGSAGLVSDYNNMFTTGAYPAVYDTAHLKTLKDWIKTTGLDSHSVSVNPLFRSNSDDHAWNPFLKKGTPLTSFSTDFDNITRSSKTPAIGANEIAVYSTDAGINRIDSLLPSVCRKDVKTLYARLANYGTDTLRSASIGWSINGKSQLSQSWSGKLAPGQTTSVKIGTITFDITGTIKCWSVGFNSGTDSNHVNDSASMYIQVKMAGGYTIGKSGADFTGFNAAVAELKRSTLCSSVTMTVFDGIYTEQVAFPYITGADASHTITFRSKSADSSKVTLQYPSAKDNTLPNYAIYLDQGRYYTFQQMSFVRTGTDSNAAVLVLSVNSDSNTFTGSRFITNKTCPAKSQNFYKNTVIYTAGASWLTINNCIIKNGSMGIQSNVTPNPNSSHLQNYQCNISHNIIDSSCYSGISFGGIKLTVSNNNIRNLVANNAIGSFVNGDSCSFYNNKIYLPGCGTGLSVALGPQTLVQNNFITVTANPYIPYSMGISAYANVCNRIPCNSYSAYINNNNINIIGNDTQSRAIYIYDGYNAPKLHTINIYNNNYINTAGGLGSVFNSAEVLKSDFNNFQISGKYTGGTIGLSNIVIPYKTLKDWTKAMKVDSGSYTLNPWYVTATDLHVRNPKLAKKGKTLAYLKTDIDGVTRGSKPCIGANELLPVANDGGVYSLISPRYNFCAGIQNFSVSLRNYGTDTLRTDSIAWSLNNIAQKSYYWSGTIAPGDTAIVNIGSAGLYYSTSTDWFASKYPNAANDAVKANDTAKYAFNSSMFGTYTIGGANPDFKTITQAVQTLIKSKVCAAVTFKIRNGTYQEQFSLPYIPDMSAINTVTFQSESGDSSKVTVTWPSSPSAKDLNYVMRLDSGTYYIFRKLGFVRTGTNSYGAVIEMANNSMDNNFSNCRFVGIKTPVSQSIAASIISRGQSWSYENVFQNSYFKNGTYVTNDASVPVKYYSRGSDTFLHNIIDSCITGIGIHNYVAYNNITNFVYDAVSQCYCIGNRIYSPLNVTHVFYNCLAYNNIISTSAPVALYQCSYIYFNNIMMFGRRPSCSLNYAAIDEGNNNTNYHIFNNNILFADTTGLSYENIYKLVNYTGIIDSTKINYNNAYAYTNPIALNVAFYASGSGVGGMGVDYLSGLKGWGKFLYPIYWPDKNSVCIDAMPSSIANPEVLNYKLAHAGTPVSGYTTDINGTKRDLLKPSIGAIEIPQVNKDIAVTLVKAPQICGDTAYAITVVLQNRGSLQQTNIPITAEIQFGSRIQKISDTIKAVIKPGLTDTFTFTSRPNMYQSGYYKIKAYASLQDDEVKSDDSYNGVFFIVGNNLPDNKKTTLCTAGKARLTLNDLSTSDKLAWYKNINDISPLSTQDTFITGIIKKDTTFYVAYNSNQHYHLGLTDTLVNPTIHASVSQPIDVKVYKTCTLDSVTVYPKKSGMMRIVITDYTSAKQLYYYYPLKILVKYPYQAVKIPINFKFTYDIYHAYFLRVDSIYCGDLASCKGNYSEKENYPISIPNVFNINGAGSLSLAANCGYSYYPYLFNWVISTSCPAERFPFKVKVGGKPTFSLDKDPSYMGSYNSGTLANPDLVCLKGTAAYRIYTSYPDSEFNLTWKIKSLSFQSLGGASSKDTQTVNPSAKKIGQFLFKPSALKSSDSIYKLTMTIGSVSGSGCDSTVSRYIRVLNAPAVKFYASNGCQGKSIQFIDSSYNTGNSVYAWDFGDTTFSTQTSPVHAYANKGSYTATLSINNIYGCGNTYSKVISVNNYPKVKMIYDSANCMKYAINFRDSSKNLSNSKRYWSFGDGAIDSTFNTYHFYKSAGGFTVKLKVINANGCADSVTHKITLYPMPKAYALADSFICLMAGSRLVDISSSPANTKRSWYFGDGTGIDTSQKVVHNYKTAGTYKTELLQITTHGCRDSVYKTITVNAMPKAVFTADASACHVKAISFRDNSINPKGKRTWSFGDGSTDTSKNPYHLYKTAGTYKIMLTITNVSGCQDSTYQNVTIYPMPAAVLKSDSAVCLIKSVQFADQSVNTRGKRTWYFGDSKTDTSINPTHNYKTAGTYTAKLVITSTSGCKDSASKTVYIHPMPKAAMKADTAVCLGKTISFSDISSSAENYLRTWNFGDSISDTAARIKHQYALPGTYTAWLWVNTSLGCRDSVAAKVKTNPTPKASFTGSNACLGDSIHFINGSTGISSKTLYSWSFDDTTNAASKDVTHLFNYAGNHLITLTVKNNTGCSDTAIGNVKVYPLPINSFSYTQPLRLNIDFKASDTSMQRYFWSFGDSAKDSSGYKPVHSYAANGAYNVILKSEDKNGCNSTVTQKIQVQKSGIAVINGQTSLNVYPNPFNSSINIDISSSKTEEIQWQLFDVSGRKVSQSDKINLQEGSNILTVKVGNIPEGIYNLRITVDGSIVNKMLIHMHSGK